MSDDKYGLKMQGGGEQQPEKQPPPPPPPPVPERRDFPADQPDPLWEPEPDKIEPDKGWDRE